MASFQSTIKHSFTRNCLHWKRRSVREGDGAAMHKTQNKAPLYWLVLILHCFDTLLNTPVIFLLRSDMMIWFWCVCCACTQMYYMPQLVNQSTFVNWINKRCLGFLPDGNRDLSLKVQANSMCPCYLLFTHQGLKTTAHPLFIPFVFSILIYRVSEF